MAQPGKDTLVITCRHGRVDNAWDGRIYGDLQVPLSPDGREASHRLPDRLPADLHLDALVTSPLSRAREAAEAVGEARGMPITMEPDVREVGRGSWRGLSWDEVGEDALASYRNAPATFRGHGGETMQELRHRATAAVRRHAADCPGGTLLVTAHRWACSSMLLEALAAPTDRILSVTLDPLGLCAFLVDAQGAFQVLCWNHPGRLPSVRSLLRNPT